MDYPSALFRRKDPKRGSGPQDGDFESRKRQYTGFSEEGAGAGAGAGSGAGAWGGDEYESMTMAAGLVGATGGITGYEAPRLDDSAEEAPPRFGDETNQLISARPHSMCHVTGMMDLMKIDWPVLLGPQSVHSDSYTTSSTMINMAVFNARVVHELSEAWKTHYDSFMSKVENFIRANPVNAYVSKPLSDGNCLHLLMDFFKNGKALSGLHPFWGHFAMPTRRGGGFPTNKPWTAYEASAPSTYFSAMVEGHAKTPSFWGSSLPPGSTIGFRFRGMLPWEIEPVCQEGAVDAWKRGAEACRCLHEALYECYLTAPAAKKQGYLQEAKDFAAACMVTCLYEPTTDLKRGSFYSFQVLFSLQVGVSLGRSEDDVDFWELQFDAAKSNLLNPLAVDQLKFWDGDDTTEFEAEVKVRSKDAFYYKDSKGTELEMGYRGLMLFMGFQSNPRDGEYSEETFTKRMDRCPYACFGSAIRTLGIDLLPFLRNRLQFDLSDELNVAHCDTLPLFEVQAEHAYPIMNDIYHAKAPNVTYLFPLSTAPGNVSLSDLKTMLSKAAKRKKEWEIFDIVSDASVISDDAVKFGGLPPFNFELTTQANLREGMTTVRYLLALSKFKTLFLEMQAELEKAWAVCGFDALAINLTTVRLLKCLEWCSLFNLTQIGICASGSNADHARRVFLHLCALYDEISVRDEVLSLVNPTKIQELGDELISAKRVILFKAFSRRLAALEWLITNNFNSFGTVDDRCNAIKILSLQYTFFLQIVSTVTAINISSGVFAALNGRDVKHAPKDDSKVGLFGIKDVHGLLSILADPTTRNLVNGNYFAGLMVGQVDSISTVVQASQGTISVDFLQDMELRAFKMCAEYVTTAFFPKLTTQINVIPAPWMVKLNAIKIMTKDRCDRVDLGRYPENGYGEYVAT